MCGDLELIGVGGAAFRSSRVRRGADAEVPSLTPAGAGSTLAPVERECAMSWRLSGNYVETCSCELMCPCNLSIDHGATYDYCRVTLAFDVREGAVDGTDIAGCK